MKRALLLCVGLVLGAFAIPSLSQPGVQTNRAAFRAGNWYVVHSTHKTTGDVACTGFYMGRPGVQLSKDSLIIKVPGELKSIGLRFGDQPARPARAPEKSEQQIGAVVLGGADFEQLQSSKTLGLEVVTSTTRASHTLELEGLRAALKNINAGCPLTPATKRAELAAQKTREKALAERCSPQAIARMQERGMHELRIKSLCPKAELTPR